MIAAYVKLKDRYGVAGLSVNERNILTFLLNKQVVRMWNEISRLRRGICDDDGDELPLL